MTKWDKFCALLFLLAFAGLICFAAYVYERELQKSREREEIMFKVLIQK